MSQIVQDLKQFVAYASTLDGDEKGEAQVFCDRLFQAFGHNGYKEAGAVLEYRIKKGRGTSFADLVWKPRLLIEMKKQGEKLRAHYRQAFDYWINAIPNRPRYVVLCNFREFQVYDFDKQLDEPVDVIPLDDLPLRYTALNFLFPDDRRPQFNNDREAVSRKAADKMAELFRNLTHRISRPITRPQAQRFVLQTVISMFAEDMDLLPAGSIKAIVDDCLERGQSSYDLFGGLFRQMNSPTPATGGRFKGVRYFNGGLFSQVEPIDLTLYDLSLLGGEGGAASSNWSKVNPAIFGTLFQQSMDKGERHAMGAHFTMEADIQRIIGPTIVHPWASRIDAAKSAKELGALRRELAAFRVLDPACGSGNFLYIAFREIARLELQILTRLEIILGHKDFESQTKQISLISPKQFYGIDTDSFGVELAKVSLMIAKKMARDEIMQGLTRTQEELALHEDDALPLDNLDENVRCQDALFTAWPAVDAIIGNPPFQSKNKMIEELGRPYVNKVRLAYPDVPGRADYCVYWFRKAHDQLRPDERAGLVGTNTIRQNYSRHGGLDYIVSHGGSITEAVSSQVWSGDAVVHVSIVNWIRGTIGGKKRLLRQVGDRRDSPWEMLELESINSALSFGADLKDARSLNVNAKSDACYQGQTHGNDGFLIPANEAKLLIAGSPNIAEVLHPFLITDDLIGTHTGRPSRYVIDFGRRTVHDARDYKGLFKRVEAGVLKDRQAAAAKEAKQNENAIEADPKAKVAKDHAAALDRWWLLFRERGRMLKAIGARSRYIVCGRVTKRPIFSFVRPDIHPNDSLAVFALEDDYSFGILQSGIHWQWFTARCSTMKADWRYTSNTVFDSFPWPQSPSQASIRAVADAAVALRTGRDALRVRHALTLRDLYKTVEKPGSNAMKDLQERLDDAVRGAFGMPADADSVGFLFTLNQKIAASEVDGRVVGGPGLPASVPNPEPFITTDCLLP